MRHRGEGAKPSATPTTASTSTTDPEALERLVRERAAIATSMLGPERRRGKRAMQHTREAKQRANEYGTCCRLKNMLPTLKERVARAEGGPGAKSKAKAAESSSSSSSSSAASSAAAASSSSSAAVAAAVFVVVVSVIWSLLQTF